MPILLPLFKLIGLRPQVPLGRADGDRQAGHSIRFQLFSCLSLLSNVWLALAVRQQHPRK
jgi:hypothetical protein